MALIKVHAEIELPRLPNFIRYGEGDGQMFDVAEISDQDLRRIGKEWTNQLVEHARKRRNKPKELKKWVITIEEKPNEPE